MLSKHNFLTAAVLGGLLLAAPSMGSAQDGSSLHRANIILAGYGSATHSSVLNDEFKNDFSASISPILLYNMGGDVLFEAELEFGLNGDLTTTTLEYAQIDYLGFDNVIIVAGKFLVPFGIFGDRMHPSWINKLPSAPLLFGHSHGGVAEGGALLPVLSDAGVMATFTPDLGSTWGLNFTMYLTQGPTLVGAGGDDDGHGDEPEDDHGGGAEEEALAPAVGFGVAFQDNNKNKMLGGRLNIMKGSSFEMTISGFHAMYDEGNFLDYNAAAVSLQYRTAAMEFTAEGIVTRQEFQTDEGYPTLEKSGYYAQVSRRIGRWEPVVRWSQLLDGDVDGQSVPVGKEALALGLNYWIDATIPVKLAYEYLPNLDDRLLLQWAFGF